MTDRNAPQDAAASGAVLLVAQTAMEWLYRLPVATPVERYEFAQWLRESSHHAREFLLASTWDLLIHQLELSGRLDES